MADDMFIFSSNNIEPPNTFRHIWNDQNFTDTTLVTGDNQQIQAHKVILSSCSLFFRNILLKNPHQNPLLYLKDIRHKELKMVLQFIYMGQCELGQEELEPFLATGKDLVVIGHFEEVGVDNAINPKAGEISEENV